MSISMDVYLFILHGKYDILFSHCGLGFIVISPHTTLTIPLLHHIACFSYPCAFPLSSIQTLEPLLLSGDVSIESYWSGHPMLAPH